MDLSRDRKNRYQKKITDSSIDTINDFDWDSSADVSYIHLSVDSSGYRLGGLMDQPLKLIRALLCPWVASARPLIVAFWP